MKSRARLDSPSWRAYAFQMTEQQSPAIAILALIVVTIGTALSDATTRWLQRSWPRVRLFWAIYRAAARAHGPFRGWASARRIEQSTRPKDGTP